MNKKIASYTMTAAMAMTICMVSCKKDDNNTSTTPGTTTTPATTNTTTPTDTTNYNATITASNFGFDNTGGSAFSSTAAGIVQTAGTLSITGIKDGGAQSVTIMLIGVTDTGTYNLDKGNAGGHGAVISKDHTQPADGALNYKTEGNEAVTNNIGGGKVKITTFTATDAAGEFYIIAYNNAGLPAFVEQGHFSGKIKKQ